jgi:hypothetical protein
LEKTRALGSSNQYTNVGSAYWQHPVRYLEFAKRDLFRTVMVDYIPIDATMSDLLSEVRGGSLESIELIDPIGQATDYKTARVVFNTEKGATYIHEYGRDNAIKICGQEVRVYQLINGTYPVSEAIEAYEQGMSRILIMTEAEEAVLASVPEALGNLCEYVISFGRTWDGYPRIEFKSVVAAVKGLKVLQNDKSFVGVDFDFKEVGEDPCAQPYPGDEGTSIEA